MKRALARRARWGALLLAVACVYAPQADGAATHDRAFSSAAAATGAISGTVTAASGGAPVEHVAVCAVVESPGRRSGWCTTSGTDGAYTIGGLAPGQYEVEFAAGYACYPGCSQQNYLTQYYPDRQSLSEAAPVTVLEGRTTGGIDAAMQAGAEIEGRVVNAVGEAPLASVRVCAGSGAEEGRRRCAETNPEGDYLLSGLRAGSYLVQFAVPTECLSPCPLQTAFLTQFYDDSASYEQAQPIVLSAEAKVTGIDARLTEGGRITGTVRSASGGEALSGIDVCAYAIGDSAEGACAATDESGQYTLEPLASGAYQVMFFSSEVCHSTCPLQDWVTQFWKYQQSGAQGEAVEVSTEHTVSGVDALMQLGGSISGTVTGPSGAPLEGIEVCAVGEDEEGEEGSCAASGSDGAYTIQALAPGAYRVEFSSRGGYACALNCAYGYATQYYQDSASSAGAASVVVSAGAPAGGIDAQMVRAASVSDQASAGPLAGAPAPAAAIALSGTTSTASSRGLFTVMRTHGALVQVRSGKLTVRLACHGPGSCPVHLTLKAPLAAGSGARRHTRTALIASATVTIPAGASHLIALQLSRAGKALLRGPRRRLKVSLAAVELSAGPPNAWSAGVELAL